jgi:hypothetical protein
MSMYTQLLEAGLRDHEISDHQPTRSESLAELQRCRGRLRSDVVPSLPVDVLGTLTDELAYDIALVVLARGLGIDCDLFGFEQPQHERSILEKKLTTSGVVLGELGGHRLQD